VGPRPDGTIEPFQVERLKEMGKWLGKYGNTIYGTRGGPFRPTDWGVSTRKGDKIFLHILKWSGNSPKITIPDIGIKIRSVMLAGGGKAKFRMSYGTCLIEFDGKLLQPINTIVEVEYVDNIMNVKPMDVMPQSISFNKKVSVSSNPDPKWINHEWTDLKSVNNGDWSGSFWLAADDDKAPWVEIDLGKAEKFSKVVLYESGLNIKSYELQYKAGNDWKTFHKGTSVGQRSEITVSPVNAQVIRLLITSCTKAPGIYEMMLLK
jgi:alpha-L-fucosidase